MFKGANQTWHFPKNRTKTKEQKLDRISEIRKGYNELIERRVNGLERDFDKFRAKEDDLSTESAELKYDLGMLAVSEHLLCISCGELFLVFTDLRTNLRRISNYAFCTQHKDRIGQKIAAEVY